MGKTNYIYIIALSLAEYQKYINQLLNDGFTDDTFVYVDSGEMMRGRVPGKVVRLEGCSQRWNYQDIEDTIKREKIEKEDHLTDEELLSSDL